MYDGNISVSDQTRALSLVSINGELQLIHHA